MLMPKAPHERGSAMLAVIGFMIIASIVTVTIASVSIRSLGVTTATRASVQSQAAAEAGIDYALEQITKRLCRVTIVHPAGMTPEFTVTVSAGPGAPVGSPACPTVASPTVTLTSTGTAAAGGAGGNVAGDKRTVKAVYRFDSGNPPVRVNAAAMYMYGGVDFNNNAVLTMDSNDRAAIQVKNGDLACWNNSEIAGDVVVESGDIPCRFTGTRWEDGQATAAGPAPAVPDWPEFSSISSAWATYAPFPVGPGSATHPSCTLTATDMQYAGSRVIDALRCNDVTIAEKDGVKIEREAVALQGDLVIVATKFALGNGVTFSAPTGSPHKLWFITPDNNAADKVPTCVAPAGNFTVAQGFEIKPTVAALLYTPCAFAAPLANNIIWYGQMYIGMKSYFKNNLNFHYSGIEIPGLTTSKVIPEAPGTTVTQFGGRISMDDVAGNG